MRQPRPDEVEGLGQTVQVFAFAVGDQVDIDGLHGDAVQTGHVTAEHDVAHAKVVQDPAELFELAVRSACAGSTTLVVPLDLRLHTSDAAQ